MLTVTAGPFSFKGKLPVGTLPSTSARVTPASPIAARNVSGCPSIAIARSFPRPP